MIAVEADDSATDDGMQDYPAHAFDAENGEAAHLIIQEYCIRMELLWRDPTPHERCDRWSNGYLAVQSDGTAV